MERNLAQQQDDHRTKDAFDTSNASVAERGVPRFAGNDAPQAREADPAATERQREQEFLNDPTRIAMGTRQLNAAAFSGNRADLKALGQQADEKKRKAEEAYSREMQRLAEWNAQMVTIGGVRMTNAEAQRARLYCIQNEDAIAERAVRKGYIREDQKERFKYEMRREYELADREGRGIITAEEREEQDRLKRSTLAAPRGRMIADAHQELQQSAEHRQAAKPMSGSDDVGANDLFRSAPDLQGRFAAAQTGQAAAPEPEPEAAPRQALVPQPPAQVRTATATGLNL